MQPTETAVLVPIPAAESVVGTLRASLDSAAGLGVPAHVTVISPFVPPDRIDEAVISALATAIGSVPAFDATFARVAWFGPKVLWLAPEPAAPFIGLITAVWRAFPGWPPYGGAYDDPVPHLTVGIDQPAGVLAAAARAIGPDLPFTARISTAVLMQGSAQRGSWRTVAELPLGGPAAD